MKKRTKKLLSLLLSVPMTFSLLSTPTYATAVNGAAAEQESAAVGNTAEGAETEAPEENVGTETENTGENTAEPEAAGENASTQPQDEAESTEPEAAAEEENRTVVTVEETYSTYTINANDIDFSGVEPNAMTPDEDTVIDTENPAIAVVEEELNNITVLNADGESVPLTEEQIQTVLYMYQQYLEQWDANADVLGVQTPFYLQYNDQEEDGLGVLGEMLVLANVSVDDVRNGKYKYDDLVGMITNFLYGDKLGIEYYGAAVKEKRDEAMKAVKDSGAKTDVQKFLVLTDWLAQIDSFDMSYIMNSGKENPVMVAEDPQDHEHAKDIYDTMYKVYEEQLTKQFHDQFYAGIEAQLRQQYYENAIYQIVYQNAYNEYINQHSGSEEEPETPDEETPVDPQAEEGSEVDPELDAAAKEAAKQAADQFMEANKDAIAADAPGFVKETFGEEAAAQLSAGVEDFIKEAETEGIEVDPENAPGYKMTIEELTQQQMEEQQLDDLGGMTANQAIPVYADQAAQGMVTGIIGYWEGMHIGALAEGESVCMGYSRAFAYLVQYMSPEYYGVNGANTDMNVAANWKDAKDLYYNDNGELDPSQNYNVDLVRITFDADVTMYGETQEGFASDHFWNAVKVDGKWYYVDPCYIDVYTEVMMRDRVETDGSMNHLYFMLSHTSAASMYDGNYSEIKGLYNNLATHKDYEDSWVSRIKSNAYSDGSYYYYVYDSTDLISMLDEYNNSSDPSQMEVEDAEYKLVRHAITATDTGDGDTDYDTLIEFNYKENEDDETTVVRVYNPETKAMEENELLTKLYAQFEEESEAYPSLAITTAYYENKLYFNLSNCILSYDLASGDVARVKEYNTVYGKRDKTNPFGGMAFTVVDNADAADFAVTNHPIAGLVAKNDGQMYVSIATNFAYISGKDPHNSEDSSSYGYEFEESNYNPDYSSYSNNNVSDEMMEMMGYTREKNDNDEFMWSANFVDKLSISHLAGSSHNYAEVTVDPYCGRNGYTEKRCKDCGAIEADSRVEDEDSACDHHYVYFEEEYYTKDSNKNWNTGNCYVCTVCSYAITEPTEPKQSSGSFGNSNYEEQKAEYDRKKAIYDAAAESAGHTYEPTDAKWSEDSTSVTFSALECSSACPERKNILDCLLNDDKISVTLSESVTAEASVTGYKGECTTGVTATYTASGEKDGYAYTATNLVDQEPGTHTYEGEFVWTEVKDEEGNVTGYTAAADLTCAVCGDKKEDVKAEVAVDKENSVEPACEDEGKTVYVATAVVKDEDGKELGSATGTKEVVVPATGHNYVDGICTVCGAEEPAVEAPEIVSAYSKEQNSVKITWTKSEGADGYELFRATSADAEGEATSSDADTDGKWLLVKTITNGDTTEYRNVKLEVGVTYYYKVRAYTTGTDNTRKYSEFSNVSYMPATVVFDNVYSNATFRVRLLWNEIKGANGYQLWRKNDDGTYSIVKTIGDKGNTLTNDQGGTTAYSNTGLEAGKTYTYKMRAFCIPEDGKKVFGAYSDEITVAVMPATPEVTATSTKYERATVKWDQVNGAAGYQIWMSTSKDGSFSIVKSIADGKTTSYTKSDLKSGSTYYFKVRAYTEVNGKKTFGAYSDVASVKVN